MTKIQLSLAMEMKSNHYNSNIHRRRSIRLKGYDYSQAGLYFITICCQDRICRFGKIENGEMVLNDVGKMVDDEWHYLTIKYPHIILHECIVMPNHFHGVIEIANTPVGAGEPRPDVPTLGNIIGYFKYQTTKKIDLPVKLWQRNYWEHIIRNNNAYQRIANYIINNPTKWKNDRFDINS